MPGRQLRRRSHRVDAQRGRSQGPGSCSRLVGGDGAVGGRVGDAGEDEALLHLLVVEEGLVRLVDGARLQERIENGSTVSNERIANDSEAGARRAAAARRTSTLPAQDEQAPARQEYGRSRPASCAARNGGSVPIRLGPAVGSEADRPVADRMRHVPQRRRGCTGRRRRTASSRPPGS